MEYEARRHVVKSGLFRPMGDEDAPERWSGTRSTIKETADVARFEVSRERVPRHILGSGG